MDGLRIYPAPVTANQRCQSLYGKSRQQMLDQLQREIQRKPNEIDARTRRDALAEGPTAQFESAKHKEGTK